MESGEAHGRISGFVREEKPALQSRVHRSLSLLVMKKGSVMKPHIPNGLPM